MDIEMSNTCHLCYKENQFNLAYGPEEMGNEEQIHILRGSEAKNKVCQMVSL